jgi:hypothetical protein
MNPERKDCADKENSNHRSHNEKSAGKVGWRGLKILCTRTDALVQKIGKQRKTRHPLIIGIEIEFLQSRRSPSSLLHLIIGIEIEFLAHPIQLENGNENMRSGMEPHPL